VKRTTKFIIGDVAAGLLLWWILPGFIGLIAFLVVIGAPIVAYNMLDATQKRRLKGLARREIGR